MATAKTITLTCGAVEVTTRAPRYPEGEYRRGSQVIGRSWGGAFRVADLAASGTDREELELHFVGLTRDEYEDIRDLITDTADFTTEALTYTDPWSADHTNLHYVSGLEGAQATRGDRWEMTLVFAKDMEA